MRKSQAQIRAAVAKGVNGHGAPFATKELGTDAVPMHRIAKWRDGTKDPRVWELRELAPGMIRRNPDAALQVLSDVLGLDELGLVLSYRSRARPEQALPAEALDVGAAAGQLAAVVQRATADRHVSAEEGEEIAAAGRAVQVEAAQVMAIGEEASLASQPRLALAGGPGL